MKINSLLAATLAFVLVAGLGTPAFAGTDPFEGEDNAVWLSCFIVISESGDCSITFGPSEFLHAPLFATWDCIGVNDGSDCIVTVPNFVDPLLVKEIHITTDFAQVDDVLCFNDVDFVFGPDPLGEPGIRDSTTPNSPDGVIEEWRCEPNPDFETITFTLTSNEVSNIEIHTVSKGTPPPPPPTPPVVGGELLPIDSTALLVANVQTNAAWMIPVVLSGIGIGLFVVSRKSE